MNVTEHRPYFSVPIICLAVLLSALCFTSLPANATTPQDAGGLSAAPAQEPTSTTMEESQPGPPVLDAVTVRPGERGFDQPARARQIQEALQLSEFTFNPKDIPDPFKPFIAPAEAPPPVAAVGDEDLDTLPPEPQRPLTPLQRMRISEVEAGLKAIMWGPLGRKAIVEDASGKGYIVSIGTPVGERNGVVTEIFNDHLVIQQESWDKKDKRMVPQNVMVKLKKTTK